MKKNVSAIVATYRIVNAAKLGKMENAEKFALIRAARELKKITVDFEDALKDARERLKPEGIEAIAEKLQAKTPLTEEESAAVAKYDADVTACMSTELDKEVEIGFAPLGEEALGHFYASNDFSINEILALGEVLGE